MQWKVDENDFTVGESGASSGGAGDGNGSGGGLRGEFRRASSVGPSSGHVASTADFGPAPMDEEEDEDENILPGRAPHFARYLAQEISSDHFGSSSSDDEDEDEGWLAQSTFNSISSVPVTTRSFGERRPLSSIGRFDDAFDPTGSVSLAMSQDPFSPHEDDGFGPFSDPSGGPGTVGDSFIFSSSFSDEDSSFESFGDFGDFQSAEGGTLTPTSGSWTFTNEGGGSVDGSGSGGGGGGESEESSSPNLAR